MPNICTCDHGTAATGNDCLKNAMNICKSCDSGYHLEGGSCVVNKCVCPNGTPPKECPEHGAQACVSCRGKTDKYMSSSYSGYHLYPEKWYKSEMTKTFKPTNLSCRENKLCAANYYRSNTAFGWTSMGSLGATGSLSTKKTCYLDVRKENMPFKHRNVRSCSDCNPPNQPPRDTNDTPTVVGSYSVGGGRTFPQYSFVKNGFLMAKVVPKATSFLSGAHKTIHFFKKMQRHDVKEPDGTTFHGNCRVAHA